MKKAISIKQPWAYLICAGIKDIENRTWATKFRGRVYIHASGSHGEKFKVNLTDEQMIAAFGPMAKVAIKGDFHFGAIIGHVDIVNCISKQRNGKGSGSIWAEPDCFHWILRNPVLYEKPILDVKGKLSFWNCSEYLEKKGGKG